MHWRGRHTTLLECDPDNAATLPKGRLPRGGPDTVRVLGAGGMVGSSRLLLLDMDENESLFALASPALYTPGLALVTDADMRKPRRVVPESNWVGCLEIRCGDGRALRGRRPAHELPGLRVGGWPVHAQRRRGGEAREARRPHGC